LRAWIVLVVLLGSVGLRTRVKRGSDACGRKLLNGLFVESVRLWMPIFGVGGDPSGKYFQLKEWIAAICGCV
jgi:hypothetical protein